MSNVVITGSSKGIGRGLAEEFIRGGHNVVISSRSQDDSARVAAELTAMGLAKATGTACDVSVREQVQGLWDHAVASFGSVDYWAYRSRVDFTSGLRYLRGGRPLLGAALAAWGLLRWPFRFDWLRLAWKERTRNSRLSHHTTVPPSA